MIFNKKDYDSKQRFSIRKLNIGVCSVLLSTLLLTFNAQQVHAAENKSAANSNTPQTEIKKSNQQGKQSDASFVSNSTSDKSDASSAANSAYDSTAAESNKSTTLSKNISDTDKTTSINSSKTDNKTNSSSASTSNPDDKTNNLSAESNKNAVLQKAAKQSDLAGKDITKKANTQDDSAQDDSKNNTVVVSDKKADADASQLLNDSKIQLKKAKADAPANDPTPVPLHYEVGTDYIYVVVGTDIKDNPTRLFKNGQELLSAGAKLSWVTAVPTFTNADCHTPKPATIRVTYADGKHTDVNVQLYGEPQVTLQPKTFYYVKNVGDKVDFSQPDSNYNSYDTIIDADGVYSTSEMSYEPVGTIDTSTVGIHWAKIKVTDNGSPDGISKVVGDPYYVKIPYIVQGLKLRDDIPKDAAGNPIINAQLASQPQRTRYVPTTPISEFNPTNDNTSLLGQYFYQDYALAYALGITTSIDGWTQPTDLINTKSNSFKLVLNYNNGSGAYKLGDSKEQTIDVHYVAAPHIDNIYFYNDGHTYFAGQTANLQTVKKMVDSGMLNKYIYVTLADGTKVYAKTITSIPLLFKGIGGAGIGQFQAGFKATFGGTNSAGQPLVFSSDDLGNVAGAGFNDAVNYWYKKTNDTYDTVNFKALADNSWDRLSTTAYALAPTISANQGQGVADVTDGPVTYGNDSTGHSLDVYIENPATAKELDKYLDSTSAGWDWLPPAAQLNPLPNDNTSWPEGTKFTWIGSDGSKALSFDKAGEIKTGNIKVTLPSGSTYTVKSITVESHANVKAKSETIDYGTILTAADLVTNKSAFPKGTTYQFANNSEPMWIRSGSYNNVQITATYKDANGKTITTDAAKCAIAINSTRSITVLEGSSVPTVDSILNFPEGWESHTAKWSTDINTNGSNQGEITVHYARYNLDQKIGVYVTVIPKTTVKEDQQFLTNGNKYDGTAGSIANGTINQGSVLTNAGDNPISYRAYQGNPGDPKSFKQKATSYSPKFSLSGLQTNADGLVSGVQNVTVHVSVPKGTIGAKVDDAGNYYYDLSTKIEVAQPVTFEFVDDADNETVGTPQTQEFLKGQAKAIAPDLSIPTNYELATGQTLPTSYTLAKYSETNPVVKIHLRKGITVTFQGNGSKTYDGKAASLPDDVKTNTAIISSGLQNSESLNLDGLTNADFDWYQGSTKLDSAPTAVGDYTIKLNDAGLTILKNNNKNYVLTLDSKKQSYTYVINAAPATVSFQGNHIKTYDGNAATIPNDAYSDSAISANLANHESLDLSGLSASDFDWYQGNTKLDGAPTAVGDYTIKLNDTGLTALKNKNKNYTLTLDDAQGYAYHITAAAATVKFQGETSKTYDGTAATLPDDVKTNTAIISSGLQNSESLNLDGLTNADFDWYQGSTKLDSAPTAVGDYTIKLNDAGLTILKNNNKNYVLTLDSKKQSYTYVINAAPATVSFQGNHIKTYDGNAATIPNDATTAANITATGLQGNDQFVLTGLTAADFDWYQGNTKLDGAPTAVGNYTIKLNADGLTILKNNNKNYALTLDSTKSYTYTINKATASVALVGSGERDYNGNVVSDADIQKQDANNNIALKVTIPGQIDPAIVILKVDDFDWSQGTTKLTAVPKDAGTYILTLNAAGKQAIGNQLSSNHNIDWTHLDFTNIGSATYTINKATASAALSGSGDRTYNGSAVSDNDIQKHNANNTIALKITIPGVTDPQTITLKADDFDWSQGSTKLTAIPTAAGTYNLALNDNGKKAIAKKFGSSYTNIDWEQTIANGSATYTINPLTITVKQTGSSSKTYNGQPASVSSDTLSKDIESPDTINGHDLDVSGLTAADFDWYQDSTDLGTLDKAPTDVGTYTIKLNTNGLTKLKNNNKNYSFSNVADEYTYTINPVAATFAFQGNGSKTYDGQPASVSSDTLSDDIKSPDTINGHDLVVPELTNADFDWYDENGTDLGTLDKAPTNAGTYTIKLNAPGLKALKDQNKNYALTLDSTKSYTYVINKATASAALAGSGERDYNGNAVNNADIQNSHITLTITIPGQAATQTITLAVKDFDWSQGNTPLTSAPTDAGKYTLSLNDTGKDAIKAKFGNNTNIDWDGTTTSGSATYTINKAKINVTLSNVNGGQTVDYKDAGYGNQDINSKNYKVTLEKGLTYTLQNGDLEFVPSENPLNAGNYDVQLSAQGRANISAVQSKNYTYNFDNTGTGTFTIEKVTPTVKLNGSGSKVYDGNGPQNNDFTAPITLAITAPGSPTITLVNGDYQFVGSDNKIYASPVNVGTYTIELTDQGKNKISQSNINAVNLDWGNVDLTKIGTGSFTIKKASATAALNGKNNRDYKGSAITTSDLNANGGNITVTISIPNINKTIAYTLQDGDYSWDKGAAPINAGTYTLTLNKDSVLTHLQAKIDTNSALKGNIDLTKDDLSGSAAFTINQVKSTISLGGNTSVTYDGKQVTTPFDKLKQNINSTNFVNNEKLDLSGLTTNDFDWYQDKTKLSEAPTDAGIYTIKLNDAGLESLKSKNSNYALTLGTNGYTYTIKRAIGTIVFNGNHTEIYTGQANAHPASDFSLTLGVQNKNDYNYHETYTLKDNDLVYSLDGTHWTSTVPVNVGKYQVKLSNQGWQDLKKFNSDNITWAATSTPFNYAKDEGYYTITVASASAKLSGSNQRNYNGNTVTTADINANGGNIQVVLTFPGAATGNNTFTLSDDQYTWQTTGNVAPKGAGTYTLVLNNTGLTALQNYIDSVAGKGNVKLDANNMTGSAKFTINKVAITITQGGSGSMNYNGQPAITPTTALTNNISNDGGMVSGETLNIPSLSASDFDWYDANGNKLDNAPTDAGNYTIKLNSNGLKKLQDNNTNYSLNSVVDGDFAYTINQANATIKLNPSTNKQTAVWNGNTIALDPVNFKPVIPTDNSNQPTISLPSSVILTAGDYIITQNGESATAKEPGKYIVTLTEAGWQKIRDAVNGNKNYKWTSTGSGLLTINKASATITLKGQSTVTYTGSVAQIPYNKYSVTLSNGKTYTLQAGDLEFASTGNTNVGTYYVKLSDAAITHIKKLDGAHYDYSYDKSTAKLEVKAAQATATLNGSGSHIYDGHTATLSGNYTVNLSNGMTYTLQDGDYTWADGSAPTNVGNYKIILTTQGQEHIKALSSNYVWTFNPSKATYDITAQRMGIIVDGEASKVWDGDPAKITTDDDLKDITISWGNTSTEPDGINYNFKPSDFEVVDSAGNLVSDVNYNSVTGKDSEIYYIRLKQTAIDALQKKNKNYQFVFDKDKSTATYTIYARKAALTLTGSQTVNYGTDPGSIDLSKFNVDFSNWLSTSGSKPSIKLNNGDLRVVTTDNNNYSDGLPINAGKYKVVMTDQLINRLKSSYQNYDFDNISDVKDTAGHVTKPGQDDKHQPAVYNVQPLQIGVTISGYQAVKYGSSDYNQNSIIDPDDYHLSFSNVADSDQTTFKGFKLQQGDLEFVTTPSNVGHYQVKLSAQGIRHLQALGVNFDKNYDWGINVDNAEGKFDVIQMPVTITIGDHDSSHPQSSVYGQTIAINPDKYSVTAKTEDGQTLTIPIALTADDFEFENGTPSNVGSYQVILSNNGLTKIENALGTKNYSYTRTGYGNYAITAAKASVSLTGNQSSTYDARAVQLSSTTGYTLTINTDNGLLEFNLTADDLQFVDGQGNKIDNPTAVGTYYVGLTTDAQNAIKKLGGNDGKNYNFDFGTKPVATYTIKTATGTATLSGSVQKNYDGQAITDLSPIKVTVDYPNTDNQTTYTLVSGDYEFVKDGKIYTTAPSGAGTYTIELTNQGKTNIKKLGNPTGQTNVDWNISGTGTYTINKVAATVTMGGSQTEPYDGTAKSLNVSNFIPSIKSGNLTTPTIPDGTLTADDYTIENGNGTVVSGPINAGTYKVYLNANGIAKIKKLAGADNFTWPDAVNTYGTLTINKVSATAKLDGNNSKVYDGQGVTTADLNKGGTIAVTITVNRQTITYKLQDGDYSWNTPDGLAPTNASSTTYQISLNKDAILDHLKDEIDKDKPDLKGNYQLTANDLSGTATFTITQKDLTIIQKGSDSKPYDGTAGSVSLKELTDGLGLANGETLNTGGLTLTDFDWSDASHINAGSYTITLNADGLNQLKTDNPNYSFNNVGGSFTYTINKGQASAILSGRGQSTYNGSQVTDTDIQNSSIKLTVTIPGQTNPSTVNLAADDFDWNNSATVPTKADTYTLTLNAKGKKAISDQLGGNTNIDWSKTSVTGKATYTITPAAGTIKLSGADGKTFDNQATNKVNNGKFTITINNGTPQDLTDGQYQIVDAQGHAVNPKKVGTYYVVLTNDAVKQLEKDTNYTWTITPNGTLNNELGTYKISAANVTVDITGLGSKPYDGKAASATQDSHVQIKLNGSSALGSITYNWQNDDFVWYQGTTQINAPINVGSYSVGLDAAQLQNFLDNKFGNGNVIVSGVNGQANFTIEKAIPEVTFRGEGSKVYDGQPITNYTMPIGLTITNDPNAGNDPITLIAGTDYVWTKDGHTYTTAPVDVGTYTIELTDAGKAKIHNATANADNLDWSKVDLSKVGTGTYTIKQAQASAILSGSGERTYNGSAVDNDDIQKQDANNNIALKITIPGVANPQTITLTVNDFDWSQGSTKLAAIPTVVGTYTLDLNDTGKRAISDQLGSNTNIDWTKTTVTGKATYTINKAAGTIVLHGSDGKTFDNQATTKVDDSKFTININGTDHTLTDGQYRIVDAQGHAVSPKDVGTYYVVLTDDAANQLKKDTNYTWTITPNGTQLSNEIGTFIIKAASATATLGGSNSKAYDGQTTTIAELNNGGTIIVTLKTKSGLTTSFKLQEGEYSWNTSDGSAPSKVGSYIITLSDAAKRNIQAQLDQKYGKGNVVLDQIAGQASFEIKAKPSDNSGDNPQPVPPVSPSQPTEPDKPTKPDKPVDPNKPKKPGHKRGKPNHKSVKVKPNKDDRKHSKLNKKGYSSNNGPKNEKLTGQSKDADAIRNKRANGPVKAAEAELGKRSMSMGKAEAGHLLTGKLNAKPKSAKESLPQTGSEQKPTLSIIGALLAGLSWIGLLGIGKRKKKDE